MEIGELIRDLRKARGWSQGRLASAVNEAYGTTLTREYVSNWECSKVKPGGFYLAALSAVLDVPLAVLENEVQRRTFLTDVAGVAIAPVVASDLLSAGFAARLAGGPPRTPGKRSYPRTAPSTCRWVLPTFSAGCRGSLS